MEKRSIQNSELVLTPDSRIYHLHLKPEEIAETVFLVGDPGRVKLMSSLFDKVDTQVENREFVTHTGSYNNKRVSVVSTGIGTDNIDIVINELDALVNIDFDTRTVKMNLKSLDLIRIGTSGALHAEIDPGSVIVSEIAGGLDNLMYFYKSINEVKDHHLEEEFNKHMQWNKDNSSPYFVHASEKLMRKVKAERYFTGITLSAPGFYAPQGRSLRMELYDSNFIDKVSSFRSGKHRINNFEMEGSALYGLSHTLGHHALTICIALANRITGKFMTDYQPQVMHLLEDTLLCILGDD
ncbi:MAG: nucleoside phosphorylase [Bacteroidales bacterium]